MRGVYRGGIEGGVGIYKNRVRGIMDVNVVIIVENKIIIISVED